MFFILFLNINEQNHILILKTIFHNNLHHISIINTITLTSIIKPSPHFQPQRHLHTHHQPSKYHRHQKIHSILQSTSTITIRRIIISLE